MLSDGIGQYPLSASVIVVRLTQKPVLIVLAALNKGAVLKTAQTLLVFLSGGPCFVIIVHTSNVLALGVG